MAHKKQPPPSSEQGGGEIGGNDNQKHLPPKTAPLPSSRFLSWCHLLVLLRAMALPSAASPSLRARASPRCIAGGPLSISFAAEWESEGALSHMGQGQGQEARKTAPKADAVVPHGTKGRAA